MIPSSRIFNCGRLLQSLFLLTLICTSALAIPDWDEVRLSVTPGVGTKDFQLGGPLPETWPETLGKPDLNFAFHGTGEGLRRLSWGEMRKGVLHKGLAILAVGETQETTIIDIEIKRIRAGVDKENLFLGLPEKNISERSESVQKDGKKSYLLPGLAIEIEDGETIGLLVHSPKSTRWRFQRWRVRPGKAAGPLKIGEMVDESIFQTIGDPHLRNKELMSWQAADSDQTLKVWMDPRTSKVTRIRGIGLPWRTPNGVTLNDSLTHFQARHPGTKSGLGRIYEESISKMPGLRATFYNERLKSFDVYPIQSEH